MTSSDPSPDPRRQTLRADELCLTEIMATAEPNPIDPGVDIGHVHLKVADVDRSLDFYCGVLGFELMQRYGDDAAFVSAGGYHHHLGLNSWESKGGSPPPPGTTGLYHTAIRYPTRRSLADALRRLTEAGIRLTGASDHGVSEALYLDDPDGNGVELYWDRPQEDWPAAAARPEGGDVRAAARPPEPPRRAELVPRRVPRFQIHEMRGKRTAQRLEPIPRFPIHEMRG